MKKYNNSVTVPWLSVVLIAPDNFKIIAETLRYVSYQDIRNTIEIIIITESRDDLELDLSLLNLFYSYRVVKLGEITNVGQCLAKGFLNAKAEIVTYCEEHSYPQAGWARQIVESHDSGYAAVGWSLVNNNPESIVSVTNFYTSFGPWISPVGSSMRNILASHHITYKVEVLKKFSENLDKLLEQETVFLYFLGQRGYNFYLQSVAVSEHINMTRLSSYLYSEYIGGRLYAANIFMFGNWSRLRKLIYILGSPLRPLSRTFRVIINLKRTGCIIALLPRMLPILLLSVIIHSLGELVGYTFGAGNSYKQNKSIELFRFRHMSDK